jgi:hypothetical protein
VRFDRLHFQEGEILFDKNNTTSIIGGIRYEFSYLIVAKLEYQNLHSDAKTDVNKLTFQLAVGF